MHRTKLDMGFKPTSSDESNPHATATALVHIVWSTGYIPGFSVGKQGAV